MAGQRVVPFLAYEDATRAIEWLGEAFGFVEDESARYTDDDGTITHAELPLEKATIFLSTPTPEYRSPKRHREEGEAARRWQDNAWVIDGLHVRVDDVDAHYERARAAGATILREPEEPAGERIYSAEDTEGHRWMFGQPSG